MKWTDRKTRTASKVQLVKMARCGRHWNNDERIGTIVGWNDINLLATFFWLDLILSKILCIEVPAEPKRKAMSTLINGAQAS